VSPACAAAAGVEVPLPAHQRDARPGPLKRDLEVYERLLIWRALRAFLGSREKTAAALGINRTTLYYKMKKYNLS
jgi:DNA-binding NtrC family response regulator